MCARKRVFPCLMLLVLFVLMSILPETANANALRDEMIAKAKEEKQLVIGGSGGDDYRDRLVNFRKQYPFITLKPVVADTASTINRIVAESRVGKASIDLVSVGTDGLELLTESGLLQKMEYPHLKDFHPGTQPRHGYFVQAFLITRVQGAYNTDLVPPSEVPKSWEDMTDPKWNGKTMIARSTDEFPAHLAFLWGQDGKLNWDRSFDFFTKIMNQKPLLANGFRDGTNRLAAGETSIFWFAAIGPPARLRFMGAPVGLIAFPKFPGPFRSFGILKGARNPASAWLFIDFITSPQGQFDYTNLVSAHLPINQKARVGKLAAWVISQNATFENAVPLPPDIVFNKEIAKKSEDFFLKLIGIK
ncbi:MAG: extracellular solute-binding protein [Desulfobacterales bacterium]|nr:extracellular solute-binding protein [Desulfobacterales bacterium]